MFGKYGIMVLLAAVLSIGSGTDAAMDAKGDGMHSMEKNTASGDQSMEGHDTNRKEDMKSDTKQDMKQETMKKGDSGMMHDASHGTGGSSLDTSDTMK